MAEKNPDETTLRHKTKRDGGLVESAANKANGLEVGNRFRISDPSDSSPEFLGHVLTEEVS